MDAGTNLAVSKSPRRKKKEVEVKPYVPYPFKDQFPRMSNCSPAVQEIMQKAIDNGDVQYAENRPEPVYVPEYFSGLKVAKERTESLDDYIKDIDTLMLRAIKNNEKKYHEAVMSYLRSKEKDLKVLLAQMAERNALDKKDKAIEELKTIVSKLELEGKQVFDQLKGSENTIRKERDRVLSQQKEKAFLEKTVKKEKRTVIDQGRQLNHLLKLC